MFFTCILCSGIKLTANDQAFVFKSELQLQREAEAEEERIKKIEDAKKLELAMETDPAKKREILLKKKAMIARRPPEDPDDKKKKDKKSATPALGKNIIVLRDAIKPGLRKRASKSGDEVDEKLIDSESNRLLPPIKESPDEEVGSLARPNTVNSGDTQENATTNIIAKGSASDSVDGSLKEELIKSGEENDNDAVELNKMEIVWVCPHDGGMGAAVVTVNFRLEGETQWQKLTYSLRESPIKVRPKQNKKSSTDDFGISAVEELGNVGPNGEKYIFDQEAKHIQLWEYIRNENWEGVESMMIKNVIGYYGNKIVARHDKV